MQHRLPSTGLVNCFWCPRYAILNAVNTARDLAGRALYESRLKHLTGLMMPDAPDWTELTEDDRERWRVNAEHEAARAARSPKD